MSSHVMDVTTKIIMRLEELKSREQACAKIEQSNEVLNQAIEQDARSSDCVVRLTALRALSC